MLSLDNERVVWREVGQEVVVLDMATGNYLSLNASGRHLWKHLVVGATAQGLAEELSAQYGLPAADAAKDAAAFVSELRALDIVVELPETREPE